MSQNVPDLSENPFNLTEDQRHALALFGTGRTFETIAEIVGVDRRTVFRWRQLPAFQQAQAERMEMRQAQYEEQMAEIVRLALMSVERKLKWAERGPSWDEYNPVKEALQVLRLLQPAQMLQPPAPQPAENAPPAAPCITAPPSLTTL